MTTDKGTQIMDGLLLTYLDNKPNLKEYFLAYMEEANILFAEIEKMYFGRFLDRAVGDQLDTIGIILQQNRRVVLPKAYFGFQGATGVIGGMADQATPAIGAVFKSENDVVGTAAPLGDNDYRKLLLVKAACMNQDTITVNQVYHYIRVILGFAPQHMILTRFKPREVHLSLKSTEVPIDSVTLATYAARYFVPAGTSFTINLT